MNKWRMKTVWLMRRLSAVPRWTVVPTIMGQNVAEHSMQVVVLADMLMNHHPFRATPGRRLDVIQMAIYHDKDEAITGDRPGPTKDATRLAASEMDQKQIIVKVADMLDAVLFCSNEMEMGNKPIEPVMQDAMRRGAEYWNYFGWDIMTGPKPDFESLCDRLRGATSMYRHTTIPEN